MVNSREAIVPERCQERGVNEDMAMRAGLCWRCVEEEMDAGDGQTFCSKSPETASFVPKLTQQLSAFSTQIHVKIT